MICMEMLGSWLLSALVCLPVSGSCLGDASGITGVWLMASGGGILEKAVVG